MSENDDQIRTSAPWRDRAVFSGEVPPGVVPATEKPAPPPLGGLLCEPNGQVSSMRAAFLFAIFVVGVVWCVLSIRAGAMQDIPWTVVVGLSAMAGGKLIQRFAEGKR